MPKFQLTVQEIIYYTATVEADTPEEAISKFEEGDDEPDLYEVDSSPLEVLTCQPS